MTKPIRIAINGLGRIGRGIIRAVYEEGYRDDIQIVAINSSGSLPDICRLLQYDSIHGRFAQPVQIDGDAICIGADRIQILANRQVEQLPWGALGVDVVCECSGKYKSRDKASKFIEAGAKKVLISAPAGEDIDAVVVYGVNHSTLTGEHQIVSNASCTTNCLAVVLDVVHRELGVVNGFMTTIHSITNDQRLLDSNHSDPRRARSSLLSMIPTSTGAAKTTGLVIPDLQGKLDGVSIRVPTANVSMLDFVCTVQKSMRAAELNAIISKAAAASGGVLAYCDEPLVSIDFNHHSASAIFDASQTKVNDTLVKFGAWYDNEWGFSNRMLDVVRYWGRL